jgi:hypothetical protein
MTFRVNRPPYKPRARECINCARAAMFVSVMEDRAVCIGCGALMFTRNGVFGMVGLACADDWLRGVGPVMGGEA